MPTTLKDVAATAGVSIATASLVINGKNGISTKTRQRVLQAAEDLNYKIRNLNDSNSESKKKTILFLKIAMHGHIVNRDHNIFISDYIDGMFQAVKERNYKLEIATIKNETIEQIISFILQRKPDGLVLLGTEFSQNDVLALAKIKSLPLVILDTYFENMDMNFVDMNNNDAVFKVIAYLESVGVNNIGLIESKIDSGNFHLRKQAFLSSMQLFGKKASSDFILHVDSTFNGAYKDMSNYLAKGIDLPDCFFCMNDIISYGCIKALKEKGIRIPEDISIIGFDNLPMSATMEPPLTTVDISKQMMGHYAIILLDELLHSSDSNVESAVKILIGANLVCRKSVKGDPEVAIR